MIILNKLDAGARVTCHSLMNDLEISARSVYRYITTLQIAKFPIDYDRKKGTYSFTDGFSLKKPNISTEEALSLALAKRMVAPLGEKISEGISRIEERITSGEVSLPRHIVMPPVIQQEISEGIFQQLNQAITNHIVVKVKYKAASDGKVSVRVL
jgi:predicted DNA-binding transcriptional regulator YafY